ncbi:Hypothetical protein PHPALM_11432 [Phytophthora palmivora]|uniref:Uncharacterized protein n=1 Tax=Phytophthora palmivora TaxID=4796 RepID=A0A2P4Y2A7_9STRA|nr:Hypothetical protein PHPALM_11432 [Phytophthora palmivora]
MQEGFATEVGDFVPVRVRLKQTVGGQIIRRDARIRGAHPDPKTRTAKSSMRKLRSLRCPTIRIRSPRDNVCSIYLTKMHHSGSTADASEEFGRHTKAARRIRMEYKNDMKSCNDQYAVLVMDFSQNLSCPRASEMPSMWFFLSLLSVSVFVLLRQRF